MKIKKRREPVDFQSISSAQSADPAIPDAPAVAPGRDGPGERIANPKPASPLGPPKGSSALAAASPRTPVKRQAPARASREAEDAAAPAGWPVYLAAFAVFVIWGALPVAFAVGYRNQIAPFQYDAFAIAVFAMLIAGPAAFVWVAAYMVRQAQKLGAETRRAQRLADEMIAPAVAAGLSTGDVVQSVREEITQAGQAADEARKTLVALRTALAAEAQALTEAAADSARKAQDLSEGLGRERAEMSQLALSLDAQANKVSDTITQQARMVAEASDLAETQLREAEASLAARAADLAAAAGEASDAARTAGEDLTRHIARLETAGVGVTQQIGAIEASLSEQRNALVTVTHALRSDQEAFAAQVAAQTDQVAEFVEQTRTLAQEMGARSNEGGQALQALMAEAQRQFQTLTDAAKVERRAFGDSTIQSMEAVAAAAAEERRKLEDQTRAAIEALARAAQETRAAAASHAQAAREQVDQLAEAAFSAGQKANQVFDTRLNEARKLIEQSSTVVEEAGAATARKLEEGAAAARAAVNELQRMVGELEERAARLPTAARGQADQVRAAVADSMEELMEQARRAAEETQAIDAAFQERVRRNYDMLSDAVRLMGTVAGGSPLPPVSSRPAPVPRPRVAPPLLDLQPEPAAPAAPEPEPEPEAKAVEPEPVVPEPVQPVLIEAEPEAVEPAVEADARPRLRLTPTATDAEFSSVFETAGGVSDERSAPEGEGWTWKELLTSIDDSDLAEGDDPDERLLNDLDAMGINAAELLPVARVEEIAVVLEAGDRHGAREVVRKLAPAATRRIARRLLTDQALKSQIAAFLKRHEGLLGEAAARDATGAEVIGLLREDAGRAYLLLDAAAGDLV